MKIKHLISLVLLAGIIFFVSCEKDPEPKPPTVSFNAMADGMEVLKGSLLTITAVAEDEDGTVTDVVLTIDGEVKEWEESTYSYKWQTQPYEVGEYELILTATDNENQTGSTILKVNIITPSELIGPCPGSLTITHNGVTYNTIQIGDQCWLRENLKNETTASIVYDNNPANVNMFGRLYNYEDAVTACPPGWHVAAFDEWCTLMQYVDGTTSCTTEGENGTDTGFKLKSTVEWFEGNNGSNQYGFNALPGGIGASDGTFSGMSEEAVYWTSTTGGGTTSTSVKMTYTSSRVLSTSAENSGFLSVRCIKD